MGEIQWDAVGRTIFSGDESQWPCVGKDGGDTTDGARCIICERRLKKQCHFNDAVEDWSGISRTWFFDYFRTREAARG